jgi:hypothetical protein
MFSVSSSFGYYTYEIKKFTLIDAVQTFTRVPGYRFNVEDLKQKVLEDNKEIINNMNKDGREEQKIVLTEIFGDQMMYPKFWSNIISQTEIDIKHQYLRLRTNNTALLPNTKTEGERSPFTDFAFWVLNHINRSKMSQKLSNNVEEKNTLTLNILSSILAKEVRMEDFISNDAS